MKILLIGATSAIAKATARLYAESGHELFLVARNPTRLAELAADLKVRGAHIAGELVQDLNLTDKHQALIDKAVSTMGHLDLALICHGTLPEQEECEQNLELTLQAINTNGVSVISLLVVLAQQFKQQRKGTLAVITSVAGDRGRQPNFIYGAAKSMVSTFLQGLRGKLLPYNVHVIDIRPGLVDSPMTAQFEKGPLWSQPELIANKIVNSVRKKKHTVYAPGYWRLIMFVVCSIPEFIFKRLKI